MKSKSNSVESGRDAESALGRHGAARGSALANRIADELMEGWQGFKAARLQLRGPDEQDMGGMNRDCVVRIIDHVIQAPNCD